MFYGLKNLKQVILPSSLSSVGKRAFSRTGHTQINVPENISTLCYDAFAYCNSLKTIVLSASIKNLEQGVFYSSKVSDIYIKVSTPPASAAYPFSSSPTIQVYTDTVSLYTQSNLGKYGNVTGGLEEIFPDDMDALLHLRINLKKYFADETCTSLKADFSAMSDTELSGALRKDKIPFEAKV